MKNSVDDGNNNAAGAFHSEGAQGDYNKCLGDLLLTDPSEDLAAVRRRGGGRVDGTCEWILERNEYTAWLVGDGPQLLRITGALGMGKTTTSSFLVEELERRAQATPGATLVYYFCDSRDRRRDTATAILRGLILQLLRKEPRYFTLIQEDYDLQGEYLFWDLDGLREIFLGILKNSTTEVYVLIDALDECERSSRRDLLSLIAHSQQSDGHIQAKFLITCRPELDILEVDVTGELRLDPRDIRNDLQSYILVSVDAVSKEKGYPFALAQSIRDTLLGRAGGTFIWVTLIIGALKQLKAPSIIEDKLQRLPLDLEEVCDMILGQAETSNAKVLETVLCLAVAAQRPLRVGELAMACALALGRWDGDIIPPTDILDGLGDDFKCCEPFVYIDPETQIVNMHRCTRDYLLGEHLQSVDSLSQYHVTPARANLIFFQVCWKYLSLDEFNQGTAFIRRGDNNELNPQALSKKFLESHCFLQYAIEEWQEHALVAIPALVNSFQWVRDNLGRMPTLRDTLLLEIAARGHEAAVRLMIDNEADVEAKGDDLRTTLHRAAYGGNEAVVNLLLECGADIGARDRWGSTVLFRAVDGGRESVVRLLLERGVDIEARSDNGCTALISAVGRCCNTAAIKILLDKGANANARDSRGMPVLIRAAQRGDVSVVKLLLENGADVEAADAWGDTAINEAARCGQEGVIELLLAEGGDVDTKGYDGRTPLIGAAVNGHEGAIRILLENGADIGEVDSDDVTALQWAAEGGHQSVIGQLLEKGSDVNAKNANGRTALQRAASCGHKEAAKQLLGQGAHIEGIDDNGQTALHQAACCGHGEIVALLLERGANIQGRNDEGWTALLGAVSHWHESVVRLLLGNGADVGVKTRAGQTALHMAATEGGSESMVRILLDNSADIEAKDKEDRTALHEAVREGRGAIVKLLLERGANIDAKDSDGRTPLIGEVVNGHETMAELLLRHGADVEAKDKLERTALVWGAAKGLEAVVRLLLESGADVSAADEYGETAIDWALRQGHWAVVHLLRAPNV
ncbi:MAG: hypothetical protein M1840_008904 [Geoglossum simile]|nr:MAG: hypothetical protein M1840_008904 [Geoglossum simile]